MHTTHTSFLLAGQTVHRITFDPATFTDIDLLWLPHHAELTDAGRKRKTDHLAGRLAAAHALRDFGITALPAIGVNGEPLWPAGIVGSITHTANCAMATVCDHPHRLVGLDCELILDPQEAEDIKDGILFETEESVLRPGDIPFSQALTLVFSAKESLFKALFPCVKEYMGFDCARVTALEEQHLTLALTRSLAGFSAGDCFTIHWQRENERIITLIAQQ
ncbi:enterobactin synthase subunit EntD [Enterobacteriaceae bacterium RIT714]|nr:enterobactin synthase subunit EntD [Enterobacteriaceae bacterium RIT714]